MERWAGRVALVTGASEGIGAALARRLVGEGMRVVGAARSLDKLQVLADELKGQAGSLIPVQCDLTQDEQVLAMFARIKRELGGVDVCINNAGILGCNPLLEGSPEEWRKVLDLNVVALCLCTREAVASMRERGVDDGHVINISSICAHSSSMPHNIHFYGGTKSMMSALAEALRQELRQQNSNIRVSAVSPGTVNTAIVFNSGRTVTEELLEDWHAKPKLEVQDVVDTLVHVLAAPPHVQILDVVVTPIQKL